MDWYRLAWIKDWHEIDMDWQRLDPMPIPCQYIIGEFASNSSSEYTRDHPT